MALAGLADVPGVEEVRARIEAPRAPIAGLTMDRPRIMGIVNVTPDSFSDGARFATSGEAIDHALSLADAGADILDIGGESTRPGAAPVSEATQLGRVMPVIEGLSGRTGAKLSIDTRNAGVMRCAAEAGVDLLNDVSALGHDPDSLGMAAASGLPVVLMHALGDPRTMQDDPRYGDVLLDVYDFLEARIAAAEAAGIARTRIVVDPGIGFGKTVEHNLRLMAGLALFHGLGTPILLGASRKSFIARLGGGSGPDKRLAGSLAAAIAGVGEGVQILRVHDVAETRQALAVWQALRRIDRDDL